MSEQTNTTERKPWEMTDDETLSAIAAALVSWGSTESYGGTRSVIEEMRWVERHAIANAAVKALVRWLDSEVIETAEYWDEVSEMWRDGPRFDLDADDWKKLKQEVGL